MRVAFDAATHTYACAATGRELLGVSAVLRLAGIVDPAAYAFPAAQAAAVRGTDVHLACELLDTGHVTLDELAADHRGYGDAWTAFLRESGAEVIESEARMGSNVYGYAGTVDRLLALPGGKRAVADIKTSAAPSRWWALQLAGYQRLAEENLGREWTRAERWTVRLTAAGHYRVDQWTDGNDAQVWIGAVRVAWWNRTHGGAK